MPHLTSYDHLGFIPAPEVSKNKNKNFAYVFGGVLLFLVGYFLFLSAPLGFPEGRSLIIDKGASLKTVSSMLKREEVIRSKTAFEFFVILFGKEKSIVSASYTFERKLPVFAVARRITGGGNITAPFTITIPEGFTNDQISAVAVLKLPKFNKEQFKIKAEGKQGYLFPDTYFFEADDTENEVIKALNDNFNKKIATIQNKIMTSGKSEKEILTMASIIEEEAKGDDDRELISGILWHRVAIGMPLQVDAVPETYKTKGLPKAPVSNPGLEAIEAAATPKTSPYLYYLHDPEGNIHYAKTFKEHVANKAKYLK